MRVAYLYYLETYRSDAFTEALAGAESVTSLHVFDFTFLRKVFRGGDIDARAQRERHLKRLAGQSAAVAYHVCPAVRLGASGWRWQVSLVLSVLLALAWGALIPLRMWRAGIERAVFYNGHPLYLLSFLYARLRRLPVHTDLGDVLYLVDNPNPWSKRLELAFLRASETIVCVSRPFKEHLCQTYSFAEQRVRILSAALPEAFPRAFDEGRNAERRFALRQLIGAAPSDLVIVYAGYRWFRHVDGKGVIDVQGLDGLCQAVERLNDRGVPSQLVIVGAPVADPTLADFTQGRYGARFHVLGRYRPLDERHTMALGGGDVLCIPSAGSRIYQLYDRFKMYEYLAAGKRVVCADVPINHDVFGDGAEYFRDDDVADLARGIEAARSRAVLFDASLNARVAERYLWHNRLAEGAISTALFDPATVVERH